MKRTDLAIAAAASQSGSDIRSVDDLADWLLAKGNEQYAAELDHKKIAEKVKLPAELLRRVIYSPSFIQSLLRQMLVRDFSPGRLSEVFSSIYVQLLSQDVSLGAKRSMLEWLVRQMGAEEPRRLAVSAEVLIQLDGAANPQEVLRDLGIRMDTGTTRSLPQETEAVIDAEVRPVAADDSVAVAAAGKQRDDRGMDQ